MNLGWCEKGYPEWFIGKGRGYGLGAAPHVHPSIASFDSHDGSRYLYKGSGLRYHLHAPRLPLQHRAWDSQSHDGEGRAPLAQAPADAAEVTTGWSNNQFDRGW